MSGLLADVFSFGNTAKRKIKGLLDDPMGSITQYINNENDRAGRFNQLTSEAAQEGAQAIKSGKSMVGPKSQQLAGLLADAYNPTGMFIGASAKTWDKAAAEKAQKLLRDGVDPRKVWKETGTFKGADGALRQEIDDSVADFPVVKKYRRSDLDASVVHEPLEAAYPDVKGIQIEFSPGGTLSGGEYRPNVKFHDIGPRESIVLRNSELSRQGNKSIGLHEIQHAIQQREGWAKGGSPESFPEVMPYDKLVKRNYNMQDVYVRAKLNGGVDPETGTSLQTAENAVNELTKQIKNWKSPDDLYRSLAGEAEARATQARMNMNAAQRREVYPFDSYDVPVDQLIVRNGLMGEAKSIPQGPQAEALETARKNAVKMLGLPENNTPMDRAKALGFDTEAFHSTGADFREFKVNPYRGAVSVAAHPSGAVNGAKAGAADGTGTGATSVMPLLMRSEGIQGLRLPQDQVSFLKTLPDVATESQVDELMKSAPKGSFWGNFFNEIQNPDGTFSYARKSEPKVSFLDVQKTSKAADGSRIPNWGDERWSSNRQKQIGGKGWLQQDESGISASIVDPSILRSRFAAFDPARVNENDLLGGVTLPMLGLLSAGGLGAAYLTSDK